MAEPCPNCHIGRLTPIQTVLVRLYGDTLVQAPNMPARQCDVCGETFFDDEALRRVDVLIGESGPPPNRHTPPPPPTDTDSDAPASPVHLRPRTK